jgi:hypothetical protein
MTDFVFFYCSDALDVLSGGVGGSVTIGFYEGYTVFGGAPTTAAAVVALTGMPAGPGVCGGAGCFGLRVGFPTLVPFADNTFIGYSWTFEDVSPCGTFGATLPVLACVVSCSGLNIVSQGSAGGVGGNPLGLGEDGQGMLDLIDQFCTAPLVQSTFTFGTATTPWAPETRTSLSMRIDEASDLAATNVSYNASVTPNADLLLATSPVLGTTWTAVLTRGTPSVAGALLVSVRKSRMPFPNGLNATPPVTGRVLIAGALLATISGTHNGTTGSVTAPIPLSFAFCGFHFAAQCCATGGGLKLSSAVEGTIGTF